MTVRINIIHQTTCKKGFLQQSQMLEFSIIWICKLISDISGPS